MLNVQRIAEDCLGIREFSSVTETFFPDQEGPFHLRSQLEYVDDKGVLPHPFVSQDCTNMHEDFAATDVSREAGPTDATATDPDLHYVRYVGGDAELGMIPTIAYDSDGMIIAIGARSDTSINMVVDRPDNAGEWISAIGSLGSSTLKVRIDSRIEYTLLKINPATLEIEWEVELPSKSVRTDEFSLTRPSKWRRIWKMLNPNLSEMFEETGGGAYFFLDNRDRAVVPTTETEIWRIDTRRGSAPERFPISSIEDDDVIAAVGPAWSPEHHYWFATSKGTVGVLNSVTGETVDIDIRDLDDAAGDETINNGFAVSHDGAFIVTSRAMYRFQFSPPNDLSLEWQTLYTNDGVDKCGQLPPAGSGTTPTLVGSKFVTICDNAKNMHVWVFDRETGEARTQEAFPTLPDGHSACENSVLAIKFSLFVGNTHCYENTFDRNPTGGFTRIDVDPSTGDLTMPPGWPKRDIHVWSAPPKYSAGSGLIYIYTLDESEEPGRWHLRGFDLNGDRQLSVPIATVDKVSWLPGAAQPFNPKVDRYDNGWGPFYIGLNEWGGSTVLVPQMQGLREISFE